MLRRKKSRLKVVKHNKVDPGCSAPSYTNPFDSDDELDRKQTHKPSTRTSSKHGSTTSNFSIKTREKSILEAANHRKADPIYPAPSCSNPLDSDDELDNKQTFEPSRTSFESKLTTPSLSTNPFDEVSDAGKIEGIFTSSCMLPSAVRNKGENDFDEPKPKTLNLNTNPFDDDGGGNCEIKGTSSSSYMPNSAERNKHKNDFCKPKQTTMNSSTDSFDDDGGSDGEIKWAFSSTYRLSSAARNQYKNDFGESGGLENQSLQELENYAVCKAGETTKAVNGCLKIAEDMRENATKTLDALHQHGEQITRTHHAAADIDHNLSKGEKVLGKLGGLFSRTWKLKKTRPIKGPLMSTGSSDDSLKKRGSSLEKREKLGLAPAPKGRSNTGTPLPEPTDALQKVGVEKAKQDDALTDLSNMLEELKDMAVDMGSEINRQNKGLDLLQDDMDELNSRVKGANQCTRHLLGK